MCLLLLGGNKCRPPADSGETFAKIPGGRHMECAYYFDTLRVMSNATRPCWRISWKACFLAMQSRSRLRKEARSARLLPRYGTSVDITIPNLCFPPDNIDAHSLPLQLRLKYAMPAMPRSGTTNLRKSNLVRISSCHSVLLRLSTTTNR